jgi:hypothetical protein
LEGIARGLERRALAHLSAGLSTVTGFYRTVTLAERSNMSEVFLDFTSSPVEPAREVRSTLIMVGIQAAREHALLRRYLELLSSEMRDRIVGLAAGSWVPVEIAVAHYSAMNRLAIDRRTIEAIGASVAEKTWKHVLAPVLARSKRIGPKPWESLAHAHETMKLSWRGSDVRIVKLAPTQALYEWAGQPCAAIPYFVTSFGSLMRALIGLFASGASYRVAPEQSSPTTVALHLSWREDEAKRSPIAAGRGRW